MTEPDTTLIVTSRGDVTADLVVRHLRHGRVHRVDPADITTGALRIEANIASGRWTFELSDDHRSTRSDRIRSIWWRKPGPTSSDEGMAQLENVLRTLDGVLWLHHPDVNTRAQYKAVQLTDAVRAGFRVPPVRIPASARSAKDFAAGGPVIAKGWAIRGPFVEATTEWESRVEGGPAVLQRLVDKDHDVRLTAVEDRLFAASVRPPGGSVDWRVEQQDAAYAAVDVPCGIARSVANYMAFQRLSYGAFDFAVDREGRWWFLECNPNGQFGFVEARTGLPISEEIAALLREGP
ncbi:hypothetical protein [Streptomyces sp. NPDC087300]|uniref:hypothetical protein n=1 Tax=Streptomyces sp. NPDC087300 TaxID=3365780 RepID=UPI0038174FE0